MKDKIKSRCVLWHYKLDLCVVLPLSSMVIFVFAWLYIGSLWRILQYASRYEIAILNHDQGFNFSVLGPGGAAFANYSAGLGRTFIAQSMNPDSNLSHVLTWLYYNSTTPLETAVNELLDGNYWGLLYFPPNMSQSILTYGIAPLSSITNVTTQVLPYLAHVPTCQFIQDQGRNQAAYSSLGAAMRLIIQQFSQGYFGALLTTSAQTTQQLVSTLNPLVWTQGLSIQIVSYNQLVYFGQNFASYAIMVLGWIGATMVVTVLAKPDPVRIKGVDYTEKNDPPEFDHEFNSIQVVLSKLFLSFLFVLSHSFFSNLVVLCLSGSYAINFAAAWFYTTYVVMSFGAMLALLCIVLGIEMLPILGTLLMILQLVTSSGIVPNRIQQDFFYIGQAFPFYYGVRGLRSIFFGSLNTSYYWGVNCGVVAAWFVACGTLAGGLAVVLKRQDKKHAFQRAVSESGGGSQMSFPIA